MTIDRDVVIVRLALMRELIADLEHVGDPDADQLNSDRLIRHAVERILGQLVDLAVAINAHLVAGLTGTAPATYRASFGALADTGVITHELAQRLAPSAGLRNVLAHEYVAIDLHLVAGAIPRARQDYADYVSEVSSALREREGR
jgi:uncharacterized protein YutE (UPF0331/DUF86 family)